MKLCDCGCGKPTRIPNRTDRSSGYQKGVPMRFLPGHYWKWRNGVGTEEWNGWRHILPSGYIQIRKDGERRIYEHVLVAENAIGRPLPPKAQVHHVNEVRSDNRNSNLVICENGKYHKLLHRRALALRQTGNVDSLKCQFCKQWGLEMLTTVNGVGYHKCCDAEYRRNLRKRRK